LRVAIIADTHMPRGGRRLPRRCVDEIERSDLVLHAGDVMTEAALAVIETIGPPVNAVHGNVDEPHLQRRLPAQRSLELGGVNVALVHDAGPRAGRLGRMRRRFPEADVVVFGHSHMPLHERKGDFQIFNPGSPTERRRAPHHTMGLARFAAGRAEFELIELS